ncbi:hypothetical protein D3C84_891550 [compost metagenome]
MFEYSDEATLDQHYKQTYDEVVSDFKKVEFALNQIETLEEWKAPEYISDGLRWLSSTLSATTDITLMLATQVEEVK